MRSITSRVNLKKKLININALYLFEMNIKSGSKNIISFLLFDFCSLFIQYHRVI